MTRETRKWRLAFSSLSLTLIILGASFACNLKKGSSPNAEQERLALTPRSEEEGQQREARLLLERQQMVRYLQKRRGPASPDDVDCKLPAMDWEPAVKLNKEGLPAQLRTSDIQKTIKGIDFSSCKAQGAVGVILVKLTIDRDGVVSSAALLSGGSQAPACVTNKFKSARFGKFSGEAMTLSYPLVVR